MQIELRMPRKGVADKRHPVFLVDQSVSLGPRSRSNSCLDLAGLGLSATGSGVKRERPIDGAVSMNFKPLCG
jgi:hypothetical protein